MRTGGTPDVVIDEETGLLSATPEELADDIRRLRGDADLGARLGAAARPHADAHFDAPSVVARVEGLYAELLERRR
jgi:glycosyltransferase involved in cell wall biosynthesis